MAKFAAEQHSAHEAFIEHLFHFTVKQPVLAYGPNTMDELHGKFTQSQLNIRELLKHIALTAATKPAGASRDQAVAQN